MNMIHSAEQPRTRVARAHEACSRSGLWVVSESCAGSYSHRHKSFFELYNGMFVLSDHYHVNAIPSRSAKAESFCYISPTTSTFWPADSSVSNAVKKKQNLLSRVTSANSRTRNYVVTRHGWFRLIPGTPTTHEDVYRHLRRVTLHTHSVHGSWMGGAFILDVFTGLGTARCVFSNLGSQNLQKITKISWVLNVWVLPLRSRFTRQPLFSDNRSIYSAEFKYK